MATSDQLSKPAARAKEAEDSAAAKGKANAELEQEIKRARDAAFADDAGLPNPR